jgi:uncharacterized protein GlcG (DUF336 family)
MRYKPVLTLEDAKKMLAAGEAEAIKNRWNIVMAILDDSAGMVALHRMDGARPGNPEIAIQKARTSALTERSSKVWEDRVNGGRISLMKMPVLPVQGGLPILWTANAWARSASPASHPTRTNKWRWQPSWRFSPPRRWCVPATERTADEAPARSGIKQEQG